jgi:hypothetical protein
MAYAPITYVDNTNPNKTTPAVPVRMSAQNTWRNGFETVIATPNVDTNYMTLLQQGAGQSIFQANGFLMVQTGTTANSETVIRSNVSWQNALIWRYVMNASQRIANQNYILELVDVVGDGLTVTFNSITSCTVAFPAGWAASQGLSSLSEIVGCSFTLCCFGAQGSPSGRFVVASVAGNNVTFTVVGFPSTGTDTCSVVGWNYHQIIYNGTTATSVTYDAQRRGYATGASTITINSTASPGHYVAVYSDIDSASVSDMAESSQNALGYSFSMRASRYMNIPTDDVPLFFQIRCLNGASAPASTTTFNLDMVQIDDWARFPVISNGGPQLGYMDAQPVVILGNGSGSNLTVQAETNPAAATNTISSAAITSSTTTALTTEPASGAIFQLNVSAVSGTTPTLDCSIQESYDGGITYQTVYQFPRVTGVLATPLYSPPIILRGSKIQLVQTVGGTTPSFTRAFFESYFSHTPLTGVRQIYDRAVAPNTLGATTATLQSMATGDNAEIVLNLGAVTTSPPSVQLQKSDDGGTTWTNIGATLAGVANSTVVQTITGISCHLVRGIVTTAGSGATLGWCLIRTF